MKREIENNAEDISSIGRHYKIPEQTLRRAYKEHLSDFNQFKLINQSMFDEQAFVFANNFGPRMGIDETSLFNGDIYTVLINKDAKGKAGTIAAIIKGTKASKVVDAIRKYTPTKALFEIKEITLDFSPSMEWIVAQIAPNAIRTIDRFHAEKLVFDALQSVRVEYRWQALQQEENERSGLKDDDQYIFLKRFNGETERQILARSKRLLYKPKSFWSEEQKKRADILFELFPDIRKAYNLSMNFKSAFSMGKLQAQMHLEKWLQRAKNSDMRYFRITAKSIARRLGGILNYFESRATNAQSENFNAKVKAFRTRLRGVNDRDFFIYRLFMLYA